ncbi:MAG TPA: hypothetical protein VNT01_01075 [Symbiobacteriaceae bacterium]|nr:hypothetical protein [Symbiobacteriaceae bacterium]
MAKPAAPAPGWWGERFQRYMLAEELLYEPLTRSQVTGADRGEARLNFARGNITAVVGSGYANTVTLKVKPLTDRDWKKAMAAVAGDADVARRLLSGAPGAELERVLAAAGIELFPTGRAPAIRCDCRNPWDCRHARVLAVRGARLLDANPFLWLEVLGRPREAVLAAVRAQMLDQAGSGGTVIAVSAERFLVTETDPDSIAVRPGETVAPDALLKLLGPLPLPEQFCQVSYWAEREVVRDGRPIWTWVSVKETADVTLARYLEGISRAAAALAAGDREPAYAGEAQVGKRVPSKHRLAQEIAEAAEQAQTILSLAELHDLCPTAGQFALGALAEALTVLGPEYVSLAGEYAGHRSAVLSGATFRHVIALPEWRRGRLSPGSDWERVLAIAGFAPPFELQIGGAVCRVLDPADPEAQDGLFAHLQPQVGDELQLTVTDPDVPVLTGSLVPLSERSQAGRLACDRAAVQKLAEHLSDRNVWTLREEAAMEFLLANGFYREGTSPAPVWLLPVVGGGKLFWGRERTLSTYTWQRREPLLGRRGLAVWQGRQVETNHFATAMMQEGHSRHDAHFAQTCLDAWCQVWPGDQRNVRQLPTIGALAHFLWNVAPVQFKAAGAAPREVMAAWFRFLAEQQPGLRGAFRDHIALSELAPAYDHRVRTLPAARDKDAMALWLLEGYGWLGPELLFAE